MAHKLEISTFLIAERKGFHITEVLGLQPIGLLGILELSAKDRWMIFDDLVARLRGASFRLHERLIVNVKIRVAEVLAGGSGPD